MNKAKQVTSQEPVLTWATGHISINTAQLLALHLPTWLHVVILIITSVSATVGARRQVTPVNTTGGAS
jgi:uncharacterized protein (DUF983 family)